MKKLMFILVLLVSTTTITWSQTWDTLWILNTQKIGNCTNADFIDDNKVITSLSNKLYLVDGQNGSIIKLLYNYNIDNDIYKMHLSPNKSFLVSDFGDSYNFHLYDLIKNEDRLLENIYPSICMDICPDNKHIAMGKSQLWIYNIDSNKVVKTLPKIHLAYLSIAYSKDGKYLACGTMTSQSFSGLIIFNTDTWEYKIVEEGVPGKIENLKFSPNGQYLAVSRTEGKSRIYETSNLKIAKEIDRSFISITQIEFTNDSKFCLLGSGLKLPKLFDIENDTFFSLSFGASINFHFNEINNNLIIPAGLTLNLFNKTITNFDENKEKIIEIDIYQTVNRIILKNSLSQELSFELYTIIGNLIDKIGNRFYEIGESEIKWNIEIKSGTYLVVAKNNSRITTQKIIIIK